MAGAARHHHAPTKGCPTTRQLIATDPQAEVYFTGSNYNGNLGVYGCAYKIGRVFMLRPCHLGEGASPTPAECKRTVRLAGTDVAFEEEGLVTVRDLRTGHTLHEVPTGTPLNPLLNTSG
jgi:hypothetical protein